MIIIGKIIVAAIAMKNNTSVNAITEPTSGELLEPATNTIMIAITETTAAKTLRINDTLFSIIVIIFCGSQRYLPKR